MGGRGDHLYLAVPDGARLAARRRRPPVDYAARAEHRPGGRARKQPDRICAQRLGLHQRLRRRAAVADAVAPDGLCGRLGWLRRGVRGALAARRLAAGGADRRLRAGGDGDHLHALGGWRYLLRSRHIARAGRRAAAQRARRALPRARRPDQSGLRGLAQLAAGDGAAQHARSGRARGSDSARRAVCARHVGGAGGRDARTAGDRSLAAVPRAGGVALHLGLPAINRRTGRKRAAARARVLRAHAARRPHGAQDA